MRYFVLLVLLALPTCALAAPLPAGFPSQTIWVSKTSAAEGETLVISTVVFNSATEALSGTLVFTANDTRIGAREFDIQIGESQVHSIEWKPRQGEYQLAARIEGTSAELSQGETPSVLITVAAPPPPSVAQQTMSQVAQIASSSVPFVREITTTIFDAIEPYRQNGIERLEEYLASSHGESEPPGAVAGTSTVNIAGFEEMQKKTGDVLSSLARTVAAGVLFIFKNIALFYPALALLVLGTLYVLARRIRRQSD